MKKIKIFMFCSLFLFLLAGCDLTALNENPNEPTSDVEYNLNDARLASTLRAGIPMEGDDEQRIKSLMIDFFAQMLDGGSGWTTKHYIMNEDWNQRMYRRVQSNVASLNIVIRNLSGRDEYINAVAVAKIWRVFITASGIDYFGPIPFASYGEIEDNPPYTSVRDAYDQFFSELEAAVGMFDKKSGNPIFNDAASDIVFGNDVKKWREFANSLRLRLAMRLSEVDAEKCAAEVGKALSSGVMESAGGNFRLPPKANGQWGQDYNYTMFQITWSGPLVMTSSFEKLVTGIGGIDFPTDIKNKRKGLTDTATPLTGVHPAKADPRAPIMFDPGHSVGDWKGMPYGLPVTVGGTGDYKYENYAELGILVKDGAPYKNRPYDVMLYEEVCFLKAEAFLRGFATGNAKDEYEKGVRASFATWGVSDKADTYLASTVKNPAGTSAAYDDQDGPGNTALEKIITQKYLALFPDMAMEAWNDKRRLNLPRMDVGIERDQKLYDAANKDIKDPANFIKRVQYPQQESQINKPEYDKGVRLLGGADNVKTPIWWDKNKNYCTSAD